MMRNRKIVSLLLSLVLCVSLLGGLFQAEAAELVINSANFPDQYFRQYVIDYFDTNHSGTLSSTEVANATHIELENEYQNCVRVTGIEHLTNLVNFAVFMDNPAYGYAPIDVDLSGNHKLTHVIFSMGGRELKLKLGNQPDLEQISIINTFLDSLDLSGCTALESLMCSKCGLKTLDLSKNTLLKSLELTGNCDLEALDLSKNPKLKSLVLLDVPLPSVDVSHCPFLDAAVRYAGACFDEENGYTYRILNGYPVFTMSSTILQLASETYNPFTDVSKSKYYYYDVLWAYYTGITGGTSATTFSPGKDCTREQIMTFLWKVNGSPEPEMTENPFPGDVNPSKYYYKPILWAVENKYASGIGNGKFGVGKPCTRAQTMTFIWKAAGSPEPSSMTNPFPVDVNPNKYYYKAILWAAENKITSGTGNGKFGVSKTCTRAQVVVFLSKTFGPKG